MTIATYKQACDASAAVRIQDTDFFAAASDEDCLLRIYSVTNPGAPASVANVTAFLEPDDPNETEADIEGAAQIGERIFWIGSHGRNKKGKERKIRQRLFATDIDRGAAGIQLRPVGTPYKRLITDLASAPDLARFNLAEAAKKAPETEGALNMEGMAPTPEGHLLVGFRNPIPDGRALLVRLRNPAALVDGSAAAANLGFAASLDLGGRGIRALEFVAALGFYLVLAGAHDNAGHFGLFRWSGDAADSAQPLAIDFGELNPEELIVLEASGSQLTLRLISDDGTDECKAAAPSLRGFRSATVVVGL